MNVSELMNTSVVSVLPEESATLAARLLQRHNLGALPVCGKDGRLRGIVTDRDIVLRCVASEEDPYTTPVKEIMSRSVSCVAPEDEVGHAARLMAQEQIRRLPVVKNGRVVGMLSLGDIAKAGSFGMEASKALSDISANVRRR